MPFCPNCKYEYVPGIEMCPDCNVKLVDALPKKEDIAVDPNVRLVNIARVNYPVEADLIKIKLDEENIPCFLANETIAQLAGGRIGLYPILIEVREADAERALEIIKQMREE